MKAFVEGTCFVCRRQDFGLGIFQHERVGWLCQVCADGGTGVKAGAMPAWQFNRAEHAALGAAGEAAGAYLDGLGRTDLTQLHPDEWRHMLRLVVDEFGHAIRREINANG